MASIFNYADEIGPTTLIIVGFLLFVFPEPATSALGAGLMLFGAAYWFWEWNRP
ncbi:hypothetical protein JK354_12480 [Haloferax volcanii]|uniref:Uncharacterized protein n=2 Tax=Haloferax volcanii TaxID=2246 RepID=D4GTJ0_HALVD|nr:hypothetical protein [Haloferax volcanii]ADE04053.1 uncharacterized protein HVO_1961 [Haloferax volcanii DS2]MBS8119947.1 hypothetical protein [Haloferax volcanii]MBS8124985.1 hypothetical protein [Haloferax volcanii]MBS8128482.1 hypothetical protein [Haloferax volcanii]MBS8132347.1 hypothetical protein [Haloferax volcanii]